MTKTFLRFTALATLAAFLGLSAVQAVHVHKVHETESSCPVCQIAHQTPALISAAAATVHPLWVRTPVEAAIVFQKYSQFVFVSHGLSPPVL